MPRPVAMTPGHRRRSLRVAVRGPADRGDTPPPAIDITATATVPAVHRRAGVVARVGPQAGPPRPSAPWSARAASTRPVSAPPSGVPGTGGPRGRSAHAGLVPPGDAGSASLDTYVAALAPLARRAHALRPANPWSRHSCKPVLLLPARAASSHNPPVRVLPLLAPVGPALPARPSPHPARPGPAPTDPARPAIPEPALSRLLCPVPAPPRPVRLGKFDASRSSRSESDTPTDLGPPHRRPRPTHDGHVRPVAARPVSSTERARPAAPRTPAGTAQAFNDEPVAASAGAALCCSDRSRFTWNRRRRRPAYPSVLDRAGPASPEPMAGQDPRSSHPFGLGFTWNVGCATVARLLSSDPAHAPSGRKPVGRDISTTHPGARAPPLTARYGDAAPRHGMGAPRGPVKGHIDPRNRGAALAHPLADEAVEIGCPRPGNCPPTAVRSARLTAGHSAAACPRHRAPTLRERPPPGIRAHRRHRRHTVRPTPGPGVRPGPVQSRLRRPSSMPAVAHTPRSREVRPVLLCSTQTRGPAGGQRRVPGLPQSRPTPLPEARPRGGRTASRATHHPSNPCAGLLSRWRARPALPTRDRSTDRSASAELLATVREALGGREPFGAP